MFHHVHCNLFLPTSTNYPQNWSCEMQKTTEKVYLFKQSVLDWDTFSEFLTNILWMRRVEFTRKHSFISEISHIDWKRKCWNIEKSTFQKSCIFQTTALIAPRATFRFKIILMTNFYINCCLEYTRAIEKKNFERKISNVHFQVSKAHLHKSVFSNNNAIFINNVLLYS